jgi:hypothetical protein
MTFRGAARPVRLSGLQQLELRELLQSPLRLTAESERHGVRL